MFKFSWHTVAQIVAVLLQFGDVATHIVPAQYKPLVAAIIGLIQYYLHQQAYKSLPPQ